jgi:dipeptidyl aminopeptidase/acylaminoacyl peptidase
MAYLRVSTRFMRRATMVSRVSVSLVLAPQLSAQAKPTVAQFLSPAYPSNLVTAKKTDRIAWVAYEKGMRNVYTAASPDFVPVRLTNFLKDDGIEINTLSLSDDGSTALFVRGTGPNRQGWVANPGSDPDGGHFATWAVRTSGGPAWRVAEGAGFAVSPDGRFAIAARNGQIYRVSVVNGGTKTAMDTGGIPFIKVWGSNGSPQWSPDGSKIAFVSSRLNHSLIGIYDGKTRTVDYIDPSFDCDGTPMWFPDGKRLLFSRRPGVPFGRQAQQGGGSLGFPAGTAAVPVPGNGRGGTDLEGGCGGGRGGGGGGGGGRGGAGRGGATANALQSSPGLYSATFSGGYTQALMVADVTTRKAHEVWHNESKDPLFANIGGMRLAGEHVVFPVQVPRDEWDRFYSVSLAPEGNPAPVRLTTNDGLIEDSAISRDGQTFLYQTNATDIERRHIWSVPVAGGTPRQVTTGRDAETDATPLSSDKYLAYLSYGIAQPPSVSVMARDKGASRIIFPTLPRTFRAPRT